MSYFVYLLHVVNHPWKLQLNHGVLVGYGPVCPKFSRITNSQYPWKGLSDFVEFLNVVMYVVKCPLKLQKHAILGLALSGRDSQSIRLPDILNLKI